MRLYLCCPIDDERSKAIECLSSLQLMHLELDELAPTTRLKLGDSIWPDERETSGD